uniref:BZIP domain-containing protein n=1 Tax=Panagrolaimus davidi TaxID=227884 RepID=A0A914QHC8_9BILA
MSSGYCNGYGSNDQYRCGPDIYYNTTYWNQEDTVATAAVTPLTPQSEMLLNCQNGEFVQPMMAATNAQSSYRNIRQNQMINKSSQYYIHEQHHQQQQIPHRNVLANSPPITVSEVLSVSHQPFHQQYQTSPQNFQVPSNSTTQNSNESYLFDGNTLTDISSAQNSCQNSAVPVTHPIHKSLEDINMDEMIQILDECNWNPNLTNDSSLVYEIPAEISSASRTDMEEDEDKESGEESLTDSDSPKRTETRGRKRIYNKKQREERRKVTYNKSYHKCAKRDAAYRQSLIEEVKKLERENNEILHKFGRLMNQSENLANFMPDEDKHYARKYIQTVKTNVEKVKINCK